MIPRIVLQNEVSLDGRMDWFTPDIGQYYELAGTWPADAILAGSETILNAPDQIPDTEVTIPAPDDRQKNSALPLLVVPDSRGRIQNWDFWKYQPYWRDVVVLCSQATPDTYREYLQEHAIDHITAGDDQVDLPLALEELTARYGVKLVRVDSGGTLNGVLLRAGLVDEVSLLIDPCLVGGTSSRSFFRAPDLTAAEGIVPLKLVHCEEVKGGVVWLRYEKLTHAKE
ncbi:dihydrofolate reductase family protein [Candidatus Neomarinimicrobiota bacterium]